LIRSTNNLKICSRIPEDVPNGILKPETFYKTKRNILATSVENDTKNVKYKSILKYNFVKPKPEKDYYTSNDNYQASKAKMQSSFINDVVHQEMERTESNKSPYKSVLPPIKDGGSNRKLPIKKFIKLNF